MNIHFGACENLCLRPKVFNSRVLELDKHLKKFCVIILKQKVVTYEL